VILFQEAFLFCGVIIMCYSRQITIQVSNQVPPPITWFICQTMVDYLNHVINDCVLKQFTGHWLLFNALNSTIIMSSKSKEEVNVRPSFEFFMDDDLGSFFQINKSCLQHSIKGVWGFGFLLSFMRTYDEKKAHNMLALMLNLRFKSLCLVSSYVDKEQGVFIV